MRIRTLIAAADAAYTGQISEYISEFHADTIEISACNTPEQMKRLLSSGKFDVALMDPEHITQADTTGVNLPLLLWTDNAGSTVPATVKGIKKHRRISRTVSDILEQYAAIIGNVHLSGEQEGHITAVWSPGGGVGKTTVALAYAASKVLENKEVFYLNLETFSAASSFLSNQGKSISTVFEMLESGTGNIKMLIQGICSSQGGIKYLGMPDNYDDVQILTAENISELISCCAEITSELVIDLTSVCDSRTRQVFDLSDKVLLVTDCTDTAGAKLAQFSSQSNVYKIIKEKTTLVINKNADEYQNATVLTEAGSGVTGVGDDTLQKINLPLIRETDTGYIYKSLAKLLLRQSTL